MAHVGGVALACWINELILGVNDAGIVEAFDAAHEGFQRARWW